MIVEQPSLRPVVVPPPISLPAAGADAPISFSNMQALLTAILVALVSAMFELSIQFYILAGPLLAGFAVAFLYSRRTRRPLALASAAKLSWMTALLNALLITVIAAVNIAVVGMGPFREQLAKQPGGEQTLAQFNSPAMVAAAALFVWIVAFALSSLMHFVGAALASRLGQSRAQP